MALVVRGLFYLRFRLFVIQENILNLSIRGLSLAYSRLIEGVWLKNGIKMPFCIQCALVIRDFSICDTLMERTYRELQGKHVLSAFWCIVKM